MALDFSKPTLITAALPYANGPLHLGHMVEYIQADIYVRFLRLSGHKPVFVCADDAHGTPIMVAARAKGVTPEELTGKYFEEHKKDFADFNIRFDNYHTTNSPENKEYSDRFFGMLKEKGFIYTKEIEQLYSEKDGMFLPDRYVKGKCPRCGTPDQYGDVCEHCNATYDASELVEPRSVISGDTPVRKKSTHYFFRLRAFSGKLEAWLEQNSELQKEVVNFVKEWIANGLQDWDISRDGPYFGFKIPGEDDKYYYVWLDAPIGYFASFVNYARKHDLDIDSFLRSRDANLIHFIGKDITYFHFLFWPAMLMAAGFTQPTKLAVHGFLTINGQKMSKSRGTFLNAGDYIKHLPPECLRYYYAANLANRIGDIDLNPQDFMERVNNELVSNIANFAYRTLKFANQHFDGQLDKSSKFGSEDASRAGIIKEAKEKFSELNLREAVQAILALSDLGNRTFQKHEPWKLVRTDRQKALDVVSWSAGIVKDLAILLSPILPDYSEQLRQQLNLKKLDISELGKPLTGPISKARIVLTPIEQQVLDRLLPCAGKFPLDIRVGRIIKAVHHPAADKLFVLQVDMGEPRQIVTGLRDFYKAEELEGKHALFLANLKPVKLRGRESNGMILTAEVNRKFRVLEVPAAKPGTNVMPKDVEIGREQIDIKEFSRLGVTVKGGKLVLGDAILTLGGAPVAVDAPEGSKVS